jgi:hypothetical protein
MTCYRRNRQHARPKDPHWEASGVGCETLRRGRRGTEDIRAIQEVHQFFQRRRIDYLDLGASFDMKACTYGTYFLERVPRGAHGRRSNMVMDFPLLQQFQ